MHSSARDTDKAAARPFSGSHVGSNGAASAVDCAPHWHLGRDSSNSCWASLAADYFAYPSASDGDDPTRCSGPEMLSGSRLLARR